jgi:hypothetical protein
MTSKKRILLPVTPLLVNLDITLARGSTPRLLAMLRWTNSIELHHHPQG